VILIVGPAAVGKSTLAKALHRDLVRGGELWLLMQIDPFVTASLSSEWVGWSKHRGAYAERGFAYARAADGSLALELGTDGRRVLQAFHRAVAAVVTSGVNVVCETLVYDEDDWAHWRASLQGVETCWVRLAAPLTELERRERADRHRSAHGLAEGMLARPPVGRYDIEADTSTDTVDTIVRRIVATS
jgi:chloramphenicol 3-O-phosphotransferase